VEPQRIPVSPDLEPVQLSTVLTLDAPDIGQALGLKLADLRLIKENSSCHIFRAKCEGAPVILKQYKGEDPSLMLQESRALDLYAEMAAANPDLIGAGTLAINPERNLLAIGWIEGEPFSRLLSRARHEGGARETARKAMGILGGYLADLRRRTVQPGAATDPFHFEYLEYCSRRLRGIPLLGRLAFRHAEEEAVEISEAYRAARPVPSAVHGDFVFRNIHISGSRVGLIDFANSLALSHPLNDYYNLDFGLQNTVLPAGIRSMLWAAFRKGLGRMDYPQAVHRFHFEWHRRRWLMLKILGQHPSDWIQAIRGLGSFARAYAPEALT